MKEFLVAGQMIGGNQSTYMIAEAGLNHNGDASLAKELIAAALDSGANAIKFQTFDTNEFIAKNSPYYEIFRNSELTPDEFIELKEYADKLGIVFFSTPFDFASADLLEKLGVELYKVASCDLTNLPFLRHIAKNLKPILLSTGMGSISEIFAALEAIAKEGNDQVALFHCVAHYPAQPEEMNLRAIPYMTSVFDLPIGLSDHTIGTLIPNASIVLGAKMVEKHFTLDKSLPGPDHQLSATPDEFREMVLTARTIEKALGEYKKVVPESTEQQILLRRSLTARQNIPADTLINADMVSIKRPGDGLRPELLDFIVGRKTSVEIKQDQQFTLEMLR